MPVLKKESTMQIEKLSPNFGAEVIGADLTCPVSDAVRKQLFDALHENIALVIRDQNFTPDQYVAAGSIFGELMLEDQPEKYGLLGYPLVRVLNSQMKDSTGKVRSYKPNWHTDHTHLKVPPKYTMMYPVALPSQGGGTSFCNSRLGFERLPVSLRNRIIDMKTVNVLSGSAAPNPTSTSLEDMNEGNQQTAVQPLVNTNPDHGGSKAVYFHLKKTENIIGMSPEDSQAFLADLLKIMVQPEVTYVHQWRMGDMLIWDNRSSMHKAGVDFDHNQLRMFHRMFVIGNDPN
jgi:alpha-ketoglutarate-dependent taurine dioxygenase